jgi:hypothetical protein
MQVKGPTHSLLPRQPETELCAGLAGWPVSRGCGSTKARETRWMARRARRRAEACEAPPAAGATLQRTMCAVRRELYHTLLRAGRADMQTMLPAAGGGHHRQHDPGAWLHHQLREAERHPRAALPPVRAAASKAAMLAACSVRAAAALGAGSRICIMFAVREPQLQLASCLVVQPVRRAVSGAATRCRQMAPERPRLFSDCCRRLQRACSQHGGLQS